MLKHKLSNCFWTLAGAAIVALAGCGESSPPPFRLNMTNVVAKQIAPDHQQAIANILGAMFGTPDKPVALPETGLDPKKLDDGGRARCGATRQGGKHGLYRRHCVHCHGISGDGRGPTAAILNPYPRDYRPGVFKFKSTYTAAAADGRGPASHRARWRPRHGDAVVRPAAARRNRGAGGIREVPFSIRGQMETALEELRCRRARTRATNSTRRATQPCSSWFMETCSARSWRRGRVRTNRSSCPKTGRSRRTTARRSKLPNRSKAGRELFYGTEGELREMPRPDGLGRRPAGRLRQLEQGEQRIHQSDG